MSKTIKIFIITFVIALVLMLGFYWLTRNKKVDTTTGNTPWYQEFNPFGSGTIIGDIINNENQNQNNTDNTGGENGNTSKFYKITDFAVAGATFLNDTRPISNKSKSEPTPKEEIIQINTNTKEGRVEIQNILNTQLSLKTKLQEDGVFGKLTIDAIKNFQKLNNLKQTGQIDEETSKYFTKKVVVNNLPEKIGYETVPSIRYVEKTNGHIHRLFLDSDTQETISNTNIPSVYEAFFDNTGKTVIYRYLSENNTISTFLATQGATRGEFLAQDINDMSFSQDKTKIFYLVKKDDGITGVVRSFGGAGGVVSFNSPLTEWLSTWAGNQKIFLTTKPSYAVNGSTFTLDTTNKTILKILGGIKGLTILPNNTGNFILFSESTSVGPLLKLFNVIEKNTINIELYGLPEKCVWGSDNINIYCAIPTKISNNQYPDVWYQGLESFEDYIIKINTKTNNKSTIINTAKETPIDAINLFLDDQENNLFFTNKKDGTLWKLDLN